MIKDIYNFADKEERKKALSLYFRSRASLEKHAEKRFENLPYNCRKYLEKHFQEKMELRNLI